MTDEVLKERKRCEQIIINAMRRNKDSPIVMSKLKLILQKIRKQSTGQPGGRSPVPPGQPSNNSTANQ